jgi:hypothetical protein
MNVALKFLSEIPRPASSSVSLTGTVMGAGLAPRRCRHSTRPLACALSTVIVLAGGVLSPHPAHAGSVTYTWHEDDGTNAQGSLVLGKIPANGQVPLSDVASFSFTVTIPKTGATAGFKYQFNKSSLTGVGFPLSVDPQTGNPTGAPPTPPTTFGWTLGMTVPNVKGGSPAGLDFDKNYSTKAGEDWAIPSGNPGVGTWIGTGHWTAAASVPEPPSAFLAAIGAVTVLTFRLLHKRRAEQRRVTGGQSGRTE